MGRILTAVPSRHSFAAADHGQSLVEIALMLPLLLITLLGLVDVGRAFAYSTAITNAAREAAYYAAQNSTAALPAVTQRACDETGFSAPGTSCGTAFSVTCTPCPSGGADVTVVVSYRVDLVSGYLFGRLMGRDSLTVRATSEFPGLSQ